MADLLKNNLSPSYIDRLAGALKKVHPRFDEKGFKSCVVDDQWKNRELKQRITHICESMGAFLPKDFEKALPILLKAAPDFGGFEALYFPEFVSTFGRDPKHQNLARKGLIELTQFSSSEFAVRPFLLQHPTKMMTWMKKLSSHPNYHVRRLASEGCRPRLPWAPALPFLKSDPRPIFPILETLKDDPELYVRKSVANNINDICKDNPSLILPILKKWMKQNPSERTKWIVNHGLRTLIKQGNSEALSLLGFGDSSQLKIGRLRLSTQKLRLGDDLELTFTLKNEGTKSQPVMIDYIVQHVKSNGSLTPKVFKLKRLTLEPDETTKISKRHKFRKINTRKYHSGTHSVQLQVNGRAHQKKTFFLNAD